MIVKSIPLYDNNEYVTLTTYVTADSGELRSQGKRPAVLICPGGAYMSCSDQEAEPVAMQFVAMGYHAFVLRYSTYNKGKSSGFFGEPQPMAPQKDTAHPAPVRDVAKAMLYLRNMSDEWLIDENRIALCGFFAGAHNVAMYSVYWDKPLLTEFFHVQAQMLRPAACILGYTLSDYVYMGEYLKHAPPLDKGLFEASNVAFLGEAVPERAVLEAVSPARLVGDTMPPTFIWATAMDKMVPVQHSIRMAHALAEHGIPFEMHIFEEGDHGLSVATQASAVALSQTNPDAAKWVSLVKNWLDKRFSLNLPEKTPFQEAMEQLGTL